jgi:DeoR/GlpR family transcriptional regulator of sugar metabolism
MENVFDLKSMTGPERQEQVLKILSHQPRVTIAHLCELLEISEATARRDLELLAEQGKVQRVHGGAISIRQAPPEPPVLLRSSEMAEEKKRIGQGAAELVRDGETIFIGSGSTMLEVAQALKERQGLTVITNSLLVCNTLAASLGITLISLGGMLRHTEMSFIGHLVEQALNELRADKVIIGIHAVDLQQGLTNDYLPETMTDRAILRVGKQVIVAADHTKLGTVSTAFVAPITAMHILVTTQEAPSNVVSALQNRGIQVIVV